MQSPILTQSSGTCLLINASLRLLQLQQKMLPVDRHVAQALQMVTRSQVPDMSDRIIAATALYLGVPLITRDRMIQTANVDTIW